MPRMIATERQRGLQVQLQIMMRLVISGVVLGLLTPPAARGYAPTATYTVETTQYGNQDVIYEIMRISRDVVNWTVNIPYQVTVRSAYFTSGGIVKAQIQYGYFDGGSVNISEAQGSGMMTPYLATEVTVSGTIKYRAVLVKIPAYMTANIEVIYNTTPVTAITNASQVFFTGTNSATSGAGFYDGTVNYAALAVGYTGSTAPTGGAILQGNVGIGTAAPASPSGFSKILDITGPSPGVVLSSTSAGGRKFTIGSNASGGSGWLELHDETANATRMIIDASGNVGIGTTAPCANSGAPANCKMSVNGAIQAKEVVVNTGWSDYVFAPGYTVAPLVEIAAYIMTNHHLPGIPSQTEVEKTGVGLGEMQVRLLAKIEELTLHMIEADQKNREMAERLARVEALMK